MAEFLWIWADDFGFASKIYGEFLWIWDLTRIFLWGTFFDIHFVLGKELYTITVL